MILRSRRLVSLAIAVWWFCGTAIAQTNLGRIVGIVQDPSGSAIPGVTIVVTNRGTGWTREFVSGASGDYEIANLVAGRYSVTAELPGFKRFVQPEVLLEAGRTVRIDVLLEVGTPSDEVRVEARTTVIESESSAISNQMPYALHIKAAGTSGGRPWEMLATMPTFQSGQSDFVYSIAGGRGAQTEFHIDGIASPSTGSPLGSTSMTMEGTQELKVQAVNNSAEYSQPGIFQQLSRSGTNEFHGSLRYYHENSVLNSRNPTAPAKGSSRTHQYGAWFGGPLRIPRVYDGRNRTFVMISYEGSLSPSNSIANATVPTARMREGDFSGFAAIRDPFTGQAFEGNRIPASRINAVSRRLQERFYPLPNFGDPGTLATNNHRILWANRGKANNADIRIDQKLGRANTIYGRFGWIQFPNHALESMLPTIGRRNQLRNLRSGVLSDTHAFTPSLVNEFRIGMQRSHNRIKGPQEGLEVLSALGIEGIRNVPDAFGMPLISILGVQTLTQNQQTVNVEQSAQLTDAVTWIRGRHTWKMGVDGRLQFPNVTTVPTGTYGNFSFTNAFSGIAYADFLLGLPLRSQRTFPSPSEYLRQYSWGFFVQDDFKPTARLTLQLGLRYEYQTPTGHLRDVLYNFDPASGQILLASESARTAVSRLFNPSIPIAVADGARFPRGRLWHSDRNNLAPRIGFAFRPGASDDLVLRGAYGIFYDAIGVGIAQNFLAGPFTAGAEDFTNRITGGAPAFQFPMPFPPTPAGPSTARRDIFAVIPELRSAYVQQWNLTLEKEVQDVGLRASYIGTKGTQLFLRRNINQPAPSPTPFEESRRPYSLFQNVLLVDQGGNSIYHALQLEAKRRFGTLAFNLGYTWSNTISDVADAGGDWGGQMENAFDRKAERGREEYAIGHRLVGVAAWKLPLGRERAFLRELPAPLEHVLGGWETVWTFFLESGPWFSPVFSGSDPSNTNVTAGRPDRIGDGNLSERSLQRWFDPSAFAVPARNAGRFGNSGRNVLQAPGFTSTHLGLVKEFMLVEDLRFALEAAVSNLFNHPNFAGPHLSGTNNNITSPTVAQIGTLRDGLERGRFRTIQIRLRLQW